MIASEASPASTISPHLQGVETETYLTLSKPGFYVSTACAYWKVGNVVEDSVTGIRNTVKIIRRFNPSKV